MKHVHLLHSRWYVGLVKSWHLNTFYFCIESGNITHDDDLSYLKNGQNVPIFTATRSSVREAGRIVAQMLMDQIYNPDAPITKKLLEAELVVGESTGPAPT